MGFITNLAVRHQLKRHGFREEHSFVPLSSVKRAVILFDVEDVEFDECQKIAAERLAALGIEMIPFFLDMGRHDRDEIIVTGVKTTILKRNLAFCGTLPAEIIGELKAAPAELCICLADRDCPAVRCFSGIVPAKFCIGRCDYEGSPFGMVFTTPEQSENIQMNFHDSAKCLRSILEYLPRVVDDAGKTGGSPADGGESPDKQ